MPVGPARRLAAACLAALIAAFGSGLPAAALEAPEVSRTERAEVRLVSEHAVAAPGQTVALALHQELEGKWHTYWINPGDSGLAPQIAWTLPEGVEAGPIQWPVPERQPIPPLMNYGYSGEAVLISELSIPADWPAGEPIEIEAQADWLICEVICVPESQSYTLSIPTGERAATAPQNAEVFARGRASQPAPAPDLPVGYTTAAEAVTIHVAAPEFGSGGLEDIYFFPAEWGFVSHTAEQEAEAAAGALRLTVAKGDRWADGGFERPVSGILTATDPSSGEDTRIALAVTAEPGVPEAVEAVATVPPAASQPPGLGGGSLLATALGAAGLAFLGGVILNLMPCVFPVLALKALSVTRHGVHGAGARRAESLAYGAGVLASFLGVAGMLIALKTAGAAVGWGFQLQQPIVVAVLAYVLFAVGLNLSGVYEVPGRMAGIGGGLADRGGTTGSFFTGVLAVIVASPCTAPFMGAAVGYALTQSAWVTLVVFTGLAIGFALPLMTLTMVPAFARALPKPGPWMVRLRQALAFPMYLAAAWLLWVLGKLAGLDTLFAAMVGLVLLALGAWALGSGAPVSATGRRVAGIAAVIALVGAGAALAPSLGAGSGQQGARADAGAPTAPEGAEPWDPARLAALRGEGRPVFVNFTADWCISCKVNERLVLARESFREALDAAEAVYMVGDWTRRDSEILAVLERFGRAGVPLYLVYPADGGEPQVLPQILTAGIVADALAAAAPAEGDAAVSLSAGPD